MTDALTTAFRTADNIRAAAKAAAGAGGMLASVAGRGLVAHNSLTGAAEQYRHNSGWVAVAVGAIARRIAGLDIHAGAVTAKASPSLRRRSGVKYTGDDLEPLPDHELLQRVNSPNDCMVRWSLMHSTASSLLLTGRAFWWWHGSELWPVPSSWVQRSSDGWTLHPPGQADGIRVPDDELCVFMIPDPSDPHGSFSPLQSQALAVSTDEQLQQSQFRSFKNGCHPGLMIRAGRLPGTMPGEAGEMPILSDTQRQELIESIRAIYSGAVNYDEPLIVDGLIEGVEKLTHSPEEMDFLQSGEQVKSRILQAFGVSPAIVGQLENANRATAAVADALFCANTINPLCELLSQSLTAWAVRRWPGLVVWIGPAESSDPELMGERFETGLRLGVVSGNEYRREMLNLADMPGLDQPVDPFTGQPR